MPPQVSLELTTFLPQSPEFRGDRVPESSYPTKDLLLLKEVKSDVSQLLSSSELRACNAARTPNTQCVFLFWCLQASRDNRFTQLSEVQFVSS